MFLIIGLGNPGLKYHKTRHNVGFKVLDYFRKENGFPNFKLDKKSKAEISKGIINGQKIVLAKPQTYINSSGFAVKELNSLPNKEFNSFQRLIVTHDDFDLPLGEIKVSKNTSSAGHHGVQSIIDALKTQNFIRVRIGIKPISNFKSQISNIEPKNLKAEKFVLKKFSKTEEKEMKNIMKKACQEIEKIIFLASPLINSSQQHV